MKDAIPFVFLLFFSLPVWANPLSNNLTLSTSSSGNYEARNVFVNPGALGFETELNGTGLSTSYTYGYSYQKRDELAMGLTYSYFGLGWENLEDAGNEYSRFTLATGVPLNSKLFFGSRFSFTSSDTAALSGIHSVDVGLQYRPFPLISFGVMANRVNQPKISGIPQPSQLVAGVTVQPIDRLSLSFDADTLSNNFGKQIGYQAAGSFEILPGLRAYGGYNKDYKTHVGIQFDLGRARLFSAVGPESSAGGSKFIMGFQTGVLPRKSFLMPKSTIEVSLDSELSEERIEGNLFSKGSYSLLDVLETLEEVEQDSSIRGIYLKIETFPLGLAAASEVHEALLRLREQGKEIDVSLGNSGAAEYVIATAANRIHMEPSAELRLLGPRSERFYAKGTLDKIGIEGEFLAKGEYKSAPETFTRKEASPKSREATVYELKKLEEAYAGMLLRARKISNADYKKALNHALFSARDALEKEHLRKKMAYKMGQFLEGGNTVSCVSGHVYEEPRLCDLCGDKHTDDILVIKNRANKKLNVASNCLKEMVRFKVTDVEDLPRWLEKLRVLRNEMEVRKAELLRAREEERKKLEKKFIVRKRTTETA